MQPNKQRGTKGQQAQTHKRKHDKRSMTRMQKTISMHTSMEKSEQSIKMQKGTNPNPFIVLECIDVGLDH